MENSPRLAPAKKDFDSRSAFSSILNLNNTIDSILNSLGPLISSGSTTPSLPISPPALAPEACKTRASLLRSTDSGGRPNNAPIRAPLTQSRFLTGIELAYDSSLPSYARIRRLQHVGLGEIIAARELDFQWIKGRSCGRIVALKIFKKRHILEENAKPVVLNELLAYQRVEKSRVKGKAFIFCPGSSFETLKHVVFVMVSDLLRLFWRELTVSAQDFLPYTLSYLLKYRRGDREEFKRKLTAQLALALSAIHSLGFVHCDIRPENILLDAQYNARISCFTIDTLHYNNITGTWPYMAPEAIVPTDTDESVSYSATVDYWSLGCVVFELESGDKVGLSDCLLGIVDSFRRSRDLCSGTRRTLLDIASTSLVANLTHHLRECPRTHSL
ncbi:hypothetical protein H0H87_002129 [Tephrocybe sp. NHM501043]|nr:hypothetical protein H0H87_002129 [Tephrocybe sp. NHM501043]